MNQLIRRRSIRANYAAQCAHFPDVPHQRSRVNVPNDRDFVPVQIELRCFRRAPVRRNLRKLAHDERFNVRSRRFLIVHVGADVADMRVRQAHNLARITRVGENFLITGETCIENDFAAAARDRARSSSVKYAPVFERKDCRSMNFRQWSLRYTLFFFGLGGRGR